MFFIKNNFFNLFNLFMNRNINIFLILFNFISIRKIFLKIIEKILKN